MDRRSASTARVALTVPSSESQENQEPVDVKIATKSLVPASGISVNAKFSDRQDTSTRKHRRALHSIDNNRPRPELNTTRRTLLNQPLHGLQDLLDPKKSQISHGQAVASILDNKEANKATEGTLTGHKRPATTAHDETKTPTGCDGQSEGQESENLAWMDMMLALLERRYGSKTLPVCLTDLDADNMFQLPKHKKLKTGIAPVKSRSSLDAARIHTSTSSTINSRRPGLSSTNSQQIPARFDEQDQAKENKRQRLLLRHAQQIQASSVSSSTSCGCKTGCLKMYCMCFSSRGFCHAGCACDDCKNGRKNQNERVEAIQNYLANDPRAFSFASLPQEANTTGFLHLLPQKSSAVVMRGCRCKKSKCLKKYCECFQNGIACTTHCRCMDCSNHSESTAAHKHPHLQKDSATTKRVQSGSNISTATPKPFHPVHITVTKQPRRNHVGKTLRLNL